MGHLFLDIETYSSAANPVSSLNPHEPESKVIAIQYSYYDSFRPPTKAEIHAPTFLNEWESSEKEILTKFYLLLKSLATADKYLKISGYNILKFDLPYLNGRIVALGIASPKDAHDALFRPFGIDLYQVSAILPGKTRKYQQLWGISQKDANKFFGIQVKEGSGADCSRFYDAREYDKILRYCQQEFTFEQLMNAFYLYVNGLMQGKTE